MCGKVVVFVLFLLQFCHGHLNIYLNLYEVKRLLGLSAELFYVREGIINEYALNFIVPVPAHIDSLHFTWESLSLKPIAARAVVPRGHKLSAILMAPKSTLLPSFKTPQPFAPKKYLMTGINNEQAYRQLPYEITVDVSNQEALDKPYLNISQTGTVPTATQIFSVALPCSGLMAAEVNVTISISITISKLTNNVTTLNFRRKKICLQTDYESQQVNPVIVDTVISDSPSANIFYIAVGCAIALIVVIAMFVPAYYVKNKKVRRQGEIVEESRNGSNSSGQAHTTFLSTDTSVPHNHFSGTSASSCKSGASYASFRRLPSYSLLDERSKDLHERIAELTIQRCRVRLRSVVLEGTFGRVYHGSYTDEDGLEEDVLVKTVTDHASQVQISLLLQEGMTMYALNNKNVLSVLGVSIEDHTAPFLIYPYNGYTNMKKFLQKCKLCPEGVAHTLTTQEVVDMALQIITGMQYLHKKHLLHRDLAARNCVVDDKLRVQICDNALSRDLFPSDYHCLGDNENRPIKWLAIESLLHKTFSTSSDVWSFGVVLWELTTLAQQPYVEIDPFEMAAYLKDGYRLAQPINCPDELFAVMAYCWAMSADERPTFPQLHVCLQEFYTQLTRYV